jgi:hypothetical protein
MHANDNISLDIRQILDYNLYKEMSNTVNKNIRGHIMIRNSVNLNNSIVVEVDGGSACYMFVNHIIEKIEKDFYENK